MQMLEPSPMPAGTSARRCVEAKDRQVRSGDFIAGAFDYYPWLWRQHVSKMFWVPLAVPSGVGPFAQVGPDWALRITANRLDARSPAIRVETYTLSRASRPDPITRKDSNAFYSGVGMLLPSPGRWLIVGTAGPNWGCFIMTFDGTEPEPKIR
jgi:hypothetical protein